LGCSLRAKKLTISLRKRCGEIGMLVALFLIEGTKAFLRPAMTVEELNVTLGNIVD
jgi:hypothetical protein